MKAILQRVTAAILAVGTFGTCFLAGLAYSGPNGNPSHWGAASFAVALMLAVGAHAAGHYLAARRSAVGAHLPYFMPALSMTGTGGVYVKLCWPIVDRRALFRTFAAGPIAGFAASSMVYFCGLPMSDVVPLTPPFQVTLGDSLLTAAAQSVVFRDVPVTHGVMLHPIAVAGYFGLFFNFWHLLPIGRLDAGRVVYALFGYRRAAFVSWLTVGALAIAVAFSFASRRDAVFAGLFAWVTFAALAALTMIGISRQHPRESDVEPLGRPTMLGMALLAAILVVTFVPVPIRVGP
jgi:membrane-associated protease RseP (regulator of RpoE activity)